MKIQTFLEHGQSLEEQNLLKLSPTSFIDLFLESCSGVNIIGNSTYYIPIMSAENRISKFISEYIQYNLVDSDRASDP